MAGQQDMSSLRFELQETVFLDKERPAIEQLEEIQLVPEIEVLEKGDDVRITGYLALFGQYKGKSSVNEEDEEEPNESQDYESSVKFPPFQVEQSAFSPWRKKGEIYHHIPVNIILPRDRITNMDNVFAVVDAFDYEVKSPYQLLVTAELLITGINQREESLSNNHPFAGGDKLTPVSGNEEDRETQWGNWFTKPEEKSSMGSDLENPASNESKTVEDESDYLNHPDQTDSRDSSEQEEKEESSGIDRGQEEGEADNIVPLFKEEREKQGEQEEQEEEEPSSDKDDNRKVVSENSSEEEDVKVAITSKGNTKDDRSPINLKSVFKSQKKIKDESKESQYPESSVFDAIGDSIDSGISYDSEESSEGIQSESSYAERTDEESHDDSIERADSTESSEEDALYLTQFMEEKEEDFTRLTVVIVQKEESLHSIAERYSVTVESILNRNKLDSENVEEGQILYMPR